MKNKMKFKFDEETIEKVSKLARLSLEKGEIEYFSKQFNETLGVVDGLDNIDTKNVTTTTQVTGTKNVFRNDVIEKDRTLTQSAALSNAKQVHNGYFVVKAVFDEK